MGKGKRVRARRQVVPSPVPAAQAGVSLGIDPEVARILESQSHNWSAATTERALRRERHRHTVGRLQAGLARLDELGTARALVRQELAGLEAHRKRGCSRGLKPPVSSRHLAT